MKFALTMISIICLCYIIPTHSRHDQLPYSAANTVYRGVLGCGENSTGEVIFDPPENAQIYESYTIPVTGCLVTISTCFDGDGDDIAFCGFVQGGDFDLGGCAQTGSCPGGGPGDGNSIQIDLNLANFAGNAACDGSTDGLIVVRIGTVDDAGSGNYTISLECNADCTICPIDPELDTLQQVEDAKDAIDCDEAEIVCDSSDSSDSSSSDDDARSELERMDEHDILYQYEEGKEDEMNDNEEKTYLLKVEQSVWINVYSFLAVMVLSCALFCVCMHRKNK